MQPLQPLIAVIIYGALSFAASELDRAFTGTRLISCIIIGLFIAVLCIIMARNSRLATCGIRRPETRSPQLIAMPIILGAIPLCMLVIGLVNLINTQTLGVIDVGALILLLYAAFLEELFFRGFLIDWLRSAFSLGARAGIVLGAALFAVLHLANLPTSTLPEIAMQLAFAFATGICFGCYFTRTKSIVACVIVHALINASSLVYSDTIFQFALLAVSALCALWLFASHPQRT